MTEREMMERWVWTWKEAGPELEKIRLREVRDEDSRLSLKLLERAFDQGLRTHTPSPTSGLVEMQRYFSMLPR